MKAMKKIMFVSWGAFAALAACALLLWYLSLSYQQKITQYETELSASIVADKLEDYLQARFKLVELLRQQLIRGEVQSEAAFIKTTSDYFQQFRGFHSINFIQPSGVVEWSAMAVKGTGTKNVNVSSNPMIMNLLNRTKHQLNPASSQAMQLAEGGKGFSIYQSIYKGDKLIGYLNVVLLVEPLIRSIFRHDLKQHFVFMLKDGEALIYRHGSGASMDVVVKRKIPVGDRFWSFAIGLNPWHSIPLFSLVPELSLLFSLILVGLFVWWYRRGQELKEQYENEVLRFNGLVELLPEMICELDDKLRVRFANAQALKTFGYTKDSLNHGVEIANFFAKNERFGARKLLAKLFTSSAPQKEVFEMQNTTGNTFPCEVIIEPNRDTNNELIGFRCVMRDVSAWQKAEQDIERLTHYDELTGLPNRSLFEDRLTQAISRAERSSHQVALLMIDIDRFKLVNDSLGHAAGDKILKLIANRLSSYIRQGDTLARTGSDEFALVLADCADEEGAQHGAMVVARKVLNNLLKPFIIEGREVFISGSIGISLFPQDAADRDALIRAAEAAMNHAKIQGKNNYQFYFQDFNAAANERLDIERRLRYAMKRQEFALSYQPIFDVQSKNILGIEALLAWPAAVHGQQVPTHFLRHAEENGLIVPIGKWVIKTSIEQFKKWQSQHPLPITLAINISIRQLQDDAFMTDLTAMLEEYDMSPSQLVLEIKEESLFDEKLKVKSVFEKLSQLGVQVVLDDFGTGFSSITTLSETKVTEIKIDEQFIHGVFPKSREASMVSAMIAFAHRMGLRVTAEGVETEEQYLFLKEHQCDAMQGFFFGELKTAEEMAKYLQEQFR